MANPRTPQQKYLAVTAINGFITFTTKMACAYILNTGSKNVWFTFDAAAVGSNGDGRTLLPAGVALNIPNCDYFRIGFITAGADTSDIQVIATEAPQEEGFN